MATKLEVQKKVDGLKKQIDDLSKRRAQLDADREKLTTAFEARKKQAGADALEGKDTGAADAITRERAKLETLDEALAQAGEKLGELNRELSDNEAGLARFDVNDLAADLENSIVSGIKCLLDLTGIIGEVEEKKKAFNALAGKNAVRDEYRNTNALVMFDISRIKIILNDIQKSYPALYGRAQAKR